MDRSASLVLLTIGLVLVLMMASALLIPGGRITPENYARIRPGMSEGEVEKLLGGPPGAYGSDRIIVPTMKLACLGPGLHEKTWIGLEAIISVCFDESGKVQSTDLIVPLKKSLLDELRPRLRF